jgi:DNA-binding Xre family transcriptional regulator
MLVLNLERLLQLRGITHGVSYLMNHGYTEGEARHLINGKPKMVRLALLTRLSETFQCTPNDLFDWTGDGSHVLAPLSKRKPPDILKLLEGRSPAEIEEVLRKLANGDK